MDMLEIVMLSLGGIIISFFAIIELSQIIKRGSLKRPVFSRENMMLMLEKSFPGDQHPNVLEQLDRYRAFITEVVGRTAVIAKIPGEEDRILQQLDTKVDNSEPLISQIQMSILKIAKGKMEIIKKYCEQPVKYDYRDIIIKAGYG